jgi:DNA-binding FadR family transcriptional regulator
VSGGDRIESNVLSMVSRLKTPDAAAPLSHQVEHRLAAGIAIGLLQQGQRLPSETIVARIFGVSPVTLRQALDRLRARGLVRTRTGRHGGTVFTPDPHQLDTMAREELTAMSLAYIADLGGQVATVLAACARRAAATCDEHEIEALGEAARATLAVDPLGVRRAHMLLAVKLASTSRSEGLMEMALPLAGELQALSWHGPQSAEFAEELSATCGELVAAIAAADVTRAQEITHRYAESLRSALVTARARLYAEAAATGDGGVPGMARRLEGLHRRLGAVREALDGLDPAEATGDSGPGVVDQLLRTAAEEDAELVRGAGIAFAPGLLRDQPLWLNWWDGEEPRELRFKAHTFNVAALRYYDYTRMPWFRQPLALGRLCAYGPYLDQGGIDRVTVTVGIPVSGTVFRGSVIGADLRMDGLEAALFSGREAVDPRAGAALVNAEGRVIVSSLPGGVPGTRLPGGEGFTREPLRGADPGVEALGWSVWRTAD